VIATGIGFAGTPPGGAHEWDEWWQRADGTESAIAVSAAASGAASSASAAAAATTVALAAGGVSIEVPLRITVTLGGGPAQARAEAVVQELEDLEGLREPEHDTDYETRTGYDPDFLEAQGTVRVPMPKPRDAAVIAPTRAGGDTLHYQNFSVMMHAQRRLALLTACNVTKEPKLRKPETGKDYTRKGLSGLGPNDQERWFLDPRMESKFQIPDVFFTKDRKAFDKGHIVRRDDVAFGESYEIVKRANGDSYHVTNCSPQVSGFNQSSDGVDNWGDLENHVLSEAASERLCVFAGPVLKDDDEMFFGAGGGGVKLRARIPARFWKVVVARVEDGIAAYGFVLEQDLSEVQFEEFAVAAEFVESMTPLAEIEAMTGVVFDPAVRAADQFETVRGAEVAMRAGARRRSR
jgi:endonuclease G